ncbi:MAG: ATP-grasp domain-containing protein [bacterium]|nr:ATP-grasp domain-containing protein [bacterium]
MNILILSAGTRNKVVQYFKKEAGNTGRIIATDCSELAPAIYEADAHYIVPRITEPGYIDHILEICKKEKIDGCFSLIDPELSMLAEHRDEFLAVGCTPIISPYDSVEICFDKYRMYQTLLEYGIPTGKCYIDAKAFMDAVRAGKISFPVFVKPVKGSASININQVKGPKEIEVLFSLYDDLMVQEYMNGTEYGADVYVDMISGKTKAIFVKQKIAMRAGETDKSVSVKDEELFSLISSFVERLGLRGIIDIDIFKIDGIYYISEVNPRFGGGYPHAYACGMNVPKLIFKNLHGQENEDEIGQYELGKYMMKYNEIMIR